MKKRYSIFTVVGISVLTAAVVVAALAWTGSVRKGHSVEIVTPRAPDAAVRPASWFEAQPMSFADLAQKVQSAVVNISTSKILSGRPGKMVPFPHMGPRDDFDDFFNKFFEGMPREQTQRSLGSGFIIDKNGTILTNNHVISQADEIEVQTADGKKYKAKVVGVDEKTDIAVIRIKVDKDLPYEVLGSSKAMRPGDWVMAIGNPFGLEHTVTVGVISAMGRAIGGGPYARFIQTDASINPGNSGGPLFNLKGEVIGINTMIYAGGQGIGFAIPVDLARGLLPELVEKGVVSRGWLGVSIQEVTPELAKSFGLKEENGALIAEVFSSSPAAKAGLMRGDVVLEYNGQKIDDPYDLSLAVGETKPNADAKLLVVRGSERKEFTIKMGKQEGKETSAPTDQGKAESGKADALGLVAKEITADDARQLDVPESFRGVVVERVEPGSAAEGADVRAGDVILEINSAKISALGDYTGVVGKLKKGDIVRLFIKRGRASIYLAFTL
ncbi:MAG: Do family serine endopeptidase [Pseudomonadota bacterium]